MTEWSSRDRARLLAGAAVGLGSGLLVLTLWPVLRPGANADIDAVILGARSLVVGADPYADSWRFTGPGWLWPLQYPATAILAVLPLAPLSLAVGRALFLGLGFGLLTYAVTRQAWWPLILLLSGPALQAAVVGQWSPLVTAGSLLPGLSWVLACKPNLGLCLWLNSPDRATARRLAYGVLAAIVVSLVILPTWPAGYLAALRYSPHHSLIARPFGWLLLLAIVGWRDPSARLLVGLALVPQSASFYDALPALLTATRKSEALLLSTTSLLGYLFLLSRDRTGLEFAAVIAQGWPPVLVTLYLPALGLVLARAWRSRTARRTTHAPGGVP